MSLGVPSNCTTPPDISVKEPSVAAVPEQFFTTDEASPGFEGAEKLLEVWFVPSPHLLSPTASGASDAEDQDKDVVEPLLGLRRIPADVWQRELLDHVHCQILSHITTPHCTAYLLSESSLFVFPHKIILKTCGTTTLLRGLPALLSLAADWCSLRRVWRVFYSRKVFMFPERQPWPHCTWADEVKYLDATFDYGSAYVVGKLNGDHWNLYVTAPACADVLHHNAPALDLDPAAVLEELATMSCTSSVTLAPSIPGSRAYSPRLDPLDSPVDGKHPLLMTPCHERILELPEHDCTLEILMTKLDPARARAFYLDAHPDLVEGIEAGAAVTERSGILAALPEPLRHRVDAYQFGPCGYSLNALGPDASYATIHVTPEPHCSYASFECNLAMTRAEVHETVARMVRVFGAGHVSVTIFRSEEGRQELAAEDPAMAALVRKDDDVIIDSLALPAGEDDAEMQWRRVDRIVYELHGYALGFAYFEAGANGSRPGTPAGTNEQSMVAASALHAVLKKRAFEKMMSARSTPMPSPSASVVSSDLQA